MKLQFIPKQISKITSYQIPQKLLKDGKIVHINVQVCYSATYQQVL